MNEKITGLFPCIYKLS